MSTSPNYNPSNGWDAATFIHIDDHVKIHWPAAVFLPTRLGGTNIGGKQSIEK